MHAEEAEARQLLRELAREDSLLEPVADVGEHALADEPADRVADRPLLVVEERVDREEVARVERRRLGRGGHTRMLRGTPLHARNPRSTRT